MMKIFIATGVLAAAAILILLFFLLVFAIRLYRLKPCPICGSDLPPWLEKETMLLGKGYLFHCAGLFCNANTGWHLDKSDAIKAWNKGHVTQGDWY